MLSGFRFRVEILGSMGFKGSGIRFAALHITSIVLLQGAVCVTSTATVDDGGNLALPSVGFRV